LCQKRRDRRRREQRRKRGLPNSVCRYMGIKFSKSDLITQGPGGVEPQRGRDRRKSPQIRVDRKEPGEGAQSKKNLTVGKCRFVFSLESLAHPKGGEGSAPPRGETKKVGGEGGEGMLRT